MLGDDFMVFSIEDIEFKDIDNTFSHLNKNQVVDIINKYYAGEPVKNIIGEYNLSVLPTKLVSIFPKILTNKKCAKCGANLVVKLKSKSYGQINFNEAYCPNCGHREDVPFCKCRYCEEERRMLEENKREYIIEALKQSRAPQKSERELSPKDVLYMCVILCSLLSEDASVINPLNSSVKPITPSEKWTLEMIKDLLARDLIVVSDNSDLNAFTIPEDQNGVMYNLLEVRYDINIDPTDGDWNGMLKRLMYPDPEQFSKEFCYGMWRRIAMAESEAYLLHEMRDVRYDFNPGEKTQMVLEYLVDHFSIGQIYNIIFRAVANSTKWYSTGKVSKKRAQNSVITKCEQFGRYAIAEKWNLKVYGRIADLPESMINEVLFNSIMKISSLGFSERPTDNF